MPNKLKVILISVVVNVAAHCRERELQIKLAELQAEIQIYLTGAFGFVAGFLAILICYLQIYFDLLWEENFTLVRHGIGALMFVCVILCVIFACYFFRKVQLARAKIKELEKEYCW